MPKLNPSDLERALRELPGWEIQNDELRKRYEHNSFAESIVFVNAVANAAELMNHHPDIDIRYSKVAIALTTHDQGGITERDVALARTIEEIRRKAGVPA